jgi:phosphatidylethanolamine-binding protein
MIAFLLFEEPPSGFDIPQDAVEHKAEFDDRSKWNAESFARKNGLRLVGVNFFLTERK